MSNKLSDTSGQRLRLAMWPTHALLIVQYILLIVQYIYKRHMPLVYMRLSMRSLRLERMWRVIAQWACRLFICLSLVRLSLSVSTRSTMSRALFSHLPVLHCKVCGIFYVYKKVFCISVSHWQCIAIWVVCILQCHITNVTDKVQIAVIAVLLILLCVRICVEKLKHHRYVVNTT